MTKTEERQQRLLKSLPYRQKGGDYLIPGPFKRIATLLQWYSYSDEVLDVFEKEIEGLKGQFKRLRKGGQNVFKTP